MPAETSLEPVSATQTTESLPVPYVPLHTNVNVSDLGSNETIPEEKLREFATQSRDLLLNESRQREAFAFSNERPLTPEESELFQSHLTKAAEYLKVNGLEDYCKFIPGLDRIEIREYKEFADFNQIGMFVEGSKQKVIVFVNPGTNLSTDPQFGIDLLHEVSHILGKTQLAGSRSELLSGDIEGIRERTTGLDVVKDSLEDSALHTAGTTFNHGIFEEGSADIFANLVLNDQTIVNTMEANYFYKTLLTRLLLQKYSEKNGQDFAQNYAELMKAKFSGDFSWVSKLFLTINPEDKQLMKEYYNLQSVGELVPIGTTVRFAERCGVDKDFLAGCLEMVRLNEEKQEVAFKLPDVPGGFKVKDALLMRTPVLRTIMYNPDYSEAFKHITGT